MTDWWNKNVESRIDDFKKWLEDDKALDTQYCRDYIAKNNYKSMLDCGSGFCVNYHAFKDCGYDIEYTGVDSCKYLIETNKGINIVDANLEDKLPIDGPYDIVYSRSVAEHLKCYETFINEMIRLAKHEVIIIFFITPSDKEDFIDYWEAEDLYHNHYNKEKLENFIKSNTKVDTIHWNRDFEDGGQYNKTILHVNIKQSAND
jgi:2-polyprenyl-3-methyl-5-hydroxy-6-metoxy-1,4-benzoquinol methylase